MLRILTRNWWVLASRGVWAVLFGLAALIWPRITLIALAILFGAFAFVDGVFAIVSAIRAARERTRWWPFLVEGVVGIGIGVLTIIWPGLTALVLLYLVAVWAALTGIFRIVAAVKLRREIEREWLLILSGALSLVFAFLLLAFPTSGAVAVVWIIGVYAMIVGSLLLVLAFRLRRLKKRLEATA